jgi:xanthine dehydrogenase accessory factor
VRDLLDTLRAWRADGQAIALATVVATAGSTPRPTGARLAVSEAGDIAGSVSGGCVENDVVYHAQEVLATGEPRLVRYAITDDMVWDVGLACGGTIEVWIEQLDDPASAPPPGSRPGLQAQLEQTIDAGRLVAQALLLDGPGRLGARMLVWPSGATSGSLGDAALDRQAAADALAMLARPRAGSRRYEESAARVFIEVFPPPPHLVIFGGVHIAIPLTAMAKTLGYRVTIVDPRRKFANRERFPDADQIIPQWPGPAVEQLDIGPSTACVILTHDPKIDEPALQSLLGKGAGYLGAIGSRKTHAERFERMAQHGVSAKQLAEVYAPIGLDIGAETPQEIALAILAEIVAVRRSAPAGFMRDERPAPPSR